MFCIFAKLNFKWKDMEVVIQKTMDTRQVVKHIQGKSAIPVKDRIISQRHTPIQELIMQAPTWTDDEYNSYLENRQYINQSRLK